MDITRVVLSFILFSLAIGSFTISFFQFKERGYLFNNAYIWANREKRKRLNENKEDKTTYYRQSGFSFIYIFTHWIWMLVALVVVIIIAVVYAVISSIKIERNER